MPDIHHYFFIKASPAKVFPAISRPVGLDTWWTHRAKGDALLNGMWVLDFGPGYVWHAKVSKFTPGQAFELLLVDAHEDWKDTRVGFELEAQNEGTQVCFHHTGWSHDNDHYRTSTYCWAMYLRLLKRFVERGEVVPYGQRLEA